MSTHTLAPAGLAGRGPTAAPGPLPARPGLVLAVILVCQLMVTLDMTIVNVALPRMETSLGFSTASLSWVINAYALAFGGLLLLGARAGDLLGRRRTFLAGVTVFTLASVAGGCAGTAGWLLAARAAQGAGAALAAPAALALLTATFEEGPPRLRAIGYYTAVSIGGSAVGLVAGGLLTQWLSWRWVMFVNVPIGVVLVAAAAVVLPRLQRRSGRFDLAGALTSTAGVTAVVYGFVQAAADGWLQPATLGSFGAGGTCLGAFLLVETRAAQPITPLRLFADRSRAVAYTARLLLVAGMFGVFFFLTQFLQEVLGYGPLATGLGFVPMTVALFGSSQLSARLAGRVSSRVLVAGGVGASSIGLAWLSQLSVHSGYIMVVGPILIIGAGNGMAFVPLTALALSRVRTEDAGAASGLVNVTQQVGGALGLAVLVSVFSAVSSGSAGRAGGQLPPTAFVHGADVSFAVAAGFLVATATLVAVVLRPRHGRPAARGVDRAVDPVTPARASRPGSPGPDRQLAPADDVAAAAPDAGELPTYA